MKLWISFHALILVAFATYAHSGSTQQLAPSIPQEDSSYVDAQGTAYVTRIVPLPTIVSPEAQKYLTQPVPHPGPNATLAENRAATDAMQAHNSAANLALYPVSIASSTIAGVPVRIVTPVNPIPAGGLPTLFSRLSIRSEAGTRSFRPCWY